MSFGRGMYPMLTRGELVSADDSGAQQLVSYKGLAGEQHSEVYRPQPHGFSSVPKPGSVGWFMALGGERSRALALGFEDDSRITGQAPGTTHLYDDKGNVISVLSNGGTLHKNVEGDWEVKQSGGVIRMNSKGECFVNSDKLVHLGSSDGGGTFFVLTVAGPSKNVKAKV